MKTSDISDRDVLLAYRAYHESKNNHERAYPYEILMTRFGCAFKVAYRAMERAHRHGLIEYGVSLRTGWITHEGSAKL